MSYIYKLIDEIELNLANQGQISLSHPIFEFKGSEGKFINFAKRIYDRYNTQKLNIEPSETDLYEIKEWIKIYKSSYGEGFEDVDINSESMIIFCGIMQTFCGYFTRENLEDKKILKEYLSKSHLKNKTHILKIDTSVFKNRHWRSNDFKDAFIPFDGNSYDLQGLNGFIHPLDITYNEKFDDYNELLNIYSKDEIRHSTAWFDNLSKTYEWQKEYRLVFLMQSLEKNSSRIGCSRVYKKDKPKKSWEELVFCNIVDAIDYCCQIGPRYIYLDIGQNNINIKSIKDIID